MTSMRRTLIVRLLASLGVIVALTGTGLYLWVRASLIGEFDDLLNSRLSTLVLASRWTGKEVELDLDGSTMPWYQPGRDAEYFELRLRDKAGRDTIVARSDSLASAAKPDDWLAPEGAAVHDIRLPDGRPGRIISAEFRPAIEEETAENGGKERVESDSVPLLVASVAKGRASLDRTLDLLLAGIAGAGAAICVGVVIAVGPIVNRSLRPLGALSAHVRSIGAETLSSRVRVDGLPRELRPIHDRINDLLHRLEEAFSRERRFSGAAAHELRTPLAELRTLLEVSLRRPRGPEESREAMTEALGIVRQMEQLLGALFELVRPAAAGRTATAQSVELAPVIGSVWARHADAAEARGGRLQLDIETPLAVRANAALMEAVLDNVFANAVEYAEPTASIVCSARRTPDGAVEIDVSNPVAFVNPAQLALFFEPFWRKSESRSDRSHLGLGLSIARRLVEHMGGSVEVTAPTPDRIRVSIVLPGAAVAASPIDTPEPLRSG